ncbi:repetitive organellar protein-like [Zophobas morio]|uniref:repetitive organellar protein-like n=1 Tax=Zophobas morio TaxID=2755281 RepID=UPI003082DBF7
MGQQESKHKLDQVTQSLNRIRKDVRVGKITANDVERIQLLLQKYSRDIEGSRNVRASSVYTVEQLIEITSKELDALKQEVNLDLAAVPTNSFSRASSKKYSKDKRKSVRSITDAVQDIRRQIRNGKIQPEEYERLQQDLVNYSQLLAQKSKKSDNDAAQKLISSVTQELLTKFEEDSKSEAGSLRRPNSSLKRASLSEKRQSLTEKRTSWKEEPKKEAPKITTKDSKSTLDDIEKKLETLKTEVKVAQTNRDKSRLHFLSKSIQTLMTDLQMVNVNNQILNEERKELLEKNLQKAFQQIDKIKRQLTEESDLKYLAELHQKEMREKCVQDLDEIHKGLLTIGKNLNQKNFNTEKETFNGYKNKLNSIEEMDQEIGLKKAEVSDVLLNVENAFTRVEMEERLNQAEWRHFQYKIDLKQFTETMQSDTYKKHRQYLTQLREYVGKVLEINTKIDEKKKYVLYNIDNNIVALDQKAKDNEEKPKQVVLRKTNPSDLVAAANGLPDTYSSDELKDVVPLLTQVKAIIDHKLTLCQTKTTTDKLVPQNPSQVKRDDPDILLVTVKETSLQPVFNSVPPVHTQIDNIQKEVETLQVLIENSRYTKETQLYKDLKNKLESYRSEVDALSRDDDGAKSGENLVKYIDNVLLLLDNNMSSRKSTTEDILIDIMSVSTRVNDLGNKIQNFSRTIQDYDTIKNSLVDNKNYLKNLQITSNRGNLAKSRDDIVQQIDRYLANLEDMKKNDNASGSEEEKIFNKDLRKLKEKVSRYSGTYKNVLYKTIENDLDKYFNKADKVFKDGHVAFKVKQDIENTKMILEQKSTKDQQYDKVKRDVRQSGSKELTEIRQNVESVKETLSQNEPISKEELDKLDARLTLSILALDNIRDDHSSEAKDRLYNDIHLYFQKIQEQKLLTRASPHVVEKAQPKHHDDSQTMAMTIAKIAHELEEIKPEILSFVGTETSPNFLHIDEILVRGTLKLDEMNVDQTHELYNQKAKLMRDIHKYSDILDDRIMKTEEIEKLEKEVKIMLIKIDSFNGYFGDSEYTYLDEEIIKLKVSLGKLQVNNELVLRKEACIREVDSCMRKLNEAAKSRNNVLTGTLV